MAKLGSTTIYGDEIITGNLKISKGKIQIDNTAVTASADELNHLDGITATVDELNHLDGITATASELNHLDGITATTTELNKLDGFTGDAADLNYAKSLKDTGVTATEFNTALDGITASASELNHLKGITATTTELNKLHGATISTAELNKLEGIDYNIKNAIDLNTAKKTNVTTNLSTTTSATTVTVNSSDGTNASIPAATTTKAGVMASADKVKLDGIATNANNYIHPTYNGDDFSIDTDALTGATVISDLDINVTTDGTGHVTDANATFKTRDLTLGDLGYTGASNANHYVHPTSAGNKHIPSGGSSGKFLKYSSDGTAVWADDNNTTYSAGTGLNLTGTSFSAKYGATVGTACQGNDYRLSNARAPTTHNHNDLYYTETEIDNMKIASTTIDYVATSGQTTFNVDYTPGYVDVFINGIKLEKTAFTATNGTTVVLDNPASTSDVISISALNANFINDVSNVYSKSEIDGLFSSKADSSAIETLQGTGSIQGLGTSNSVEFGKLKVDGQNLNKDSDVIHNSLLLENVNDVSPTSVGNALQIGPNNAENLAFDTNQILKRNGDGTLGTLYINSDAFTEQYGTISTGTLLANNIIGQGQQYYDMSSSRTVNVTYTNLTERPIQVSIFHGVSNESDGSKKVGRFYIDGISRGGGGTNSGGFYFSESYIIPPGSTYKKTGVVQTWLELR